MTIVGAALTVPATVQAEGQKPASVIVFDLSGSMWAQIEGRSKVEIARDALAKLARTLDPDQPVGLVTYGHRRRGDCGDIEVLVRPGEATPAEVAKRAAALKPLGKTPLTEAVRQAADLLNIEEEPASVVLLTDGLENCDADPCALGEALEARGIAFTAHVVGFGLSEAEGQEIACLAEATGGRYVGAQDGASLADALTQTVAVAIKEEPPLQIPEASLAFPAEVAIGQAIPVTWSGPAEREDFLAVVPTGSEKTYGELTYAYVRDGSPTDLRTPAQPGTYDVVYIWAGPGKRRILAREAVKVVDAPAALSAPTGGAAGSAITVTWKGPNGAGDYIDIVEAGATRTEGELSYVYTEGGSPQTIRLPAQAGDYDLRYILEGGSGRQILASVPLKVQEATASLAFPPQVEAGAPIVVTWSGPAAPGDYVDLVPEGYAETHSELDYFYAGEEESGAMTAPGETGTYDIRYILEGPDGRAVIARQSIAVVPASVSLDAPSSGTAGSVIAVPWKGPDSLGDYVDLVPRGYTATSGELAYFYTASGNPGQLTLPETPGRYEIRYILDAPAGRSVLATVPIEVE